MSSPQHIERLTLAERTSFRRLQFLRLVLAAMLILFLDKIVDFGLHSALLLVPLAFGAWLAGYLLQRGFGFWRVLAAHAISLLCLLVILRGANFALLASSSAPSNDFLISRLGDDLSLILAFYLLGLFATWEFWTISFIPTLEAALFSGGVVWMLSGHRNYRIDAPKQISSLTWNISYLQQVNAQPQHLLLGLGILFIVFLTIYLALAAHRPLFGKIRSVRTAGARQWLLIPLFPLLLLSLLLYFAWQINATYSVDIARASNGVGSAADLAAGQSNLGFRSAVTATKQPAAIVRLETDYTDNPLKPMLYLREGALSHFNKTELVRSSAKYDRDVPHIALGQSFFAPEDDLDDTRQRLPHSVFLIGEHSAPFAIDLPKRIRPLKNPKPERFAGAYQALSFAPTAALSDLVGRGVGDESWDEETWKHYLRAPGTLSLEDFGEEPEQKPWPTIAENETPAPQPDAQGEDLRYLALSKQLTQSAADPIVRAASIIQYLSEQSIYTRSPGHEADPNGDPVAPYLFAEKKRGYCVHFAHAAVFLMRLAGIPARIATGYQTDLSNAKDGHVLLMQGDRHAWPEVYIRGQGWTVMDITPAAAENEPELVPDENLLAQLMSELDPALQFIEALPEEETTPALASTSAIFQLLNHTLTKVSAVLLVLAVLLAKAYLLWGYRLAKNPRRRAKLAYYSFAARMTDLGFPREIGETRLEYAARLLSNKQIDSRAITEIVQQRNYSLSSRYPEVSDLTTMIAGVSRAARKQRSLAFRWMAYINPFTVFRVASF